MPGGGAAALPANGDRGGQDREHRADPGPKGREGEESRPTAAVPMENPYCSCKLTRGREGGPSKYRLSSALTALIASDCMNGPRSPRKGRERESIDRIEAAERQIADKMAQVTEEPTIDHTTAEMTACGSSVKQRDCAARGEAEADQGREGPTVRGEEGGGASSPGTHTQDHQPSCFA